MKSYRFQVQLNNEIKDVYLFVLKSGLDTAKVPRIHHILIMDRSGSMTGLTRYLVENMKQVLKLILPGDLLSVLWYSSPGQFRTLIKGAVVTSETGKLLDQLNSTIGTTCFSEVLSEAGIVVQELSSAVDMSVITLFTDGMAVVPWGAWEEERRAYRVVDEMSSHISALHTIGYGNYYNRDFLMGLSSRSQYGQYTHSSDINDYIRIFNRQFAQANRLTMTPIEVHSDGEFGYLYSSGEPVAFDQYISVSSSNPEGTLVYIVNPSHVTINGEQQDLSLAQAASVPNDPLTVIAEDFKYFVAFDRFYKGQRREAAKVLADIGDIALYNKVKNAFTVNEVGTAIDALRDAAYSLYLGMPKKQSRYLSGRGHIPSVGNAFCVMDLLKVLSENNAKYRPYGKGTEAYKRISAKREGGMSFFERDETKPAEASFQGLVFSEDFLNISLRFTISGRVKLNPVQADKVNLPHVIENVTQFRNHTLIKDGQLNMAKIEVALPKATYAYLVGRTNGLMTLMGEFEDKIVASFDLSTIPLINDNYVSMSLDPDYILSLAKEIAVLKARQKVYNWFTKGTIVDEGGQQVTLTAYTPDQLALLKEHGVSDKLAYNDPGGEVVKSGDSYEARILEIGIKGSTLKSVKDVVSNFLANKKTNFMDEIMLEAYQEVLGPEVKPLPATVSLEAAEKAKELLAVLKDNLREQSTMLHTIRLGMGLSGEYPPGLKVETKGWSYGDLTIKTDRKVVEI